MMLASWSRATTVARGALGECLQRCPERGTVLGGQGSLHRLALAVANLAGDGQVLQSCGRPEHRGQRVRRQLPRRVDHAARAAERWQHAATVLALPAAVAR